MRVDPDCKLPKYIQIREWVMARISRGDIGIGEKLPTEEELAAGFNVNRMTIRQALDELVAEHMIERRRGSGTVLISDKPQGYVYELDHISAFNDDMETHGIRPIHRSLAKEIREADHDLASRLELDGDKRVVYTLSVKYVEDEPVLIERSFLPFDRFGDLMTTETNGPFYRLLVEKFNVTLHHSTQIFSAVMAGWEEAKIFDFDRPEPCMLLESVIYDDNDLPVESLSAHYRGDRYRFKAQSGEYLFRRPAEQ